jgi:hypothetical protein
MKVSDNEELGKAVKENADTIEMSRESEAGKTTYKIKATGKVAWGVCVAALTVAIALVIAGTATGGISAVAGSAVAAPAVGILGLTTVISAIKTAIAGGGVSTLNKLRGYKMEEKDGKDVFKGQGEEEIVVDEDECKTIRQNIIKHRENMDHLKSILRL